MSVRRLGLHKPSALLLLVQLTAVVAYPFLLGNRVGIAALGVISVIALGLAMVVVRNTPALSVLAIAVGLPTVALTVVESLDPTNDAVAVASGVLHAIFYAYVAYSLICYLFHDERVSTDELWAIGATFTVIAWAFAHVYVVVAVVFPGSIEPLGDNGAERFFDLLYFSFTNLTSVGLSEILPTGDHAQSVVILEQVAGVLYVTMVISRLVAMTVMRQD